MADASPPATPATAENPHQSSRSRSRSIASNHTAALLPQAVHYSPEAHPTTDPSLLALTQQQVIEVGVPPTDPALLESSAIPDAANAFAIDPALGGGSSSAPPPSTEAAPPEPSPVIEMPDFQDTPAVKEEAQVVKEEGPSGEGNEDDASPERTTKRASATEGDSDAELRRLADENKNVPLDELARRVRHDENTPSAERTRQVYGLGWLTKNCERVPDSSVAVPRNRVYARYVGICANERIKPLNPASFGKLVRLMFPEIKTRRLGVRGQSKYHYCGIRLAGEHSSPKVSHGSGSASGSEPPAHAAGDDHLLSNGFFAPIGTFGPAGKLSLNGAKSLQSPLSSFMLNELYFLRNADLDNLRIPHDAYRIPDITPYVPIGTDPDVAATLTAIYRSHCTSLVECVRYMRLKQFHQLFVSFHGTLTVPVQRLLSERSLAPWVRESDWVMYKEMIRLLSPLALQVVPSFVLSALRQLSTNLCSHISSTLAVQPTHVIEAKLGPASIFASLLDRLLRVNDAAHAAARFLGNPPDREQMVKDWQAYVNAKAIVEREMPCLAPLANIILDTEVIELLQPVSGFSNGSGGSPTPGADDEATTESVLDRWTHFLTNLPQRFRVQSPRQFNISLGAVATAALRDLTTNGAISFGSWWVVRCWIDEWMSWQAERGGFLMHGKERPLNIERRFDKRGTTTELLKDLSREDTGIATHGTDPHISLLEDIADNRVNRMVPVNFGK